MGESVTANATRKAYLSMPNLSPCFRGFSVYVVEVLSADYSTSTGRKRKEVFLRGCDGNGDKPFDLPNDRTVLNKSLRRECECGDETGTGVFG